MSAIAIAPEDYLVARAALKTLRRVLITLHQQPTTLLHTIARDSAALDQLAATLDTYAQESGVEAAFEPPDRDEDMRRIAQAIAGEQWRQRVAVLDR